jgi:hypothetical protein
MTTTWFEIPPKKIRIRPPKIRELNGGLLGLTDSGTQDSRDGEDKNSASQSSRNRKQKRAILTPPKKALVGQSLISDFVPIKKSLNKSARASLE